MKSEQLLYSLRQKHFNLKEEMVLLIQDVPFLDNFHFRLFIQDKDSWTEAGCSNAQVTGFDANGNLLGISPRGNSTVYQLHKLNFDDLSMLYQTITKS